MPTPKKIAIEPLTETQYLRNLLAQLRRELEASKAQNAELSKQLFETQYLYEDLKRDLEAIAKIK